MEAIKIWEHFTMGNNKNRGKSAEFWKDVERRGLIPQRTGDSMRNFLKTRLNLGLERFLEYALEEGIRFSHAFDNIPQISQY